MEAATTLSLRHSAAAVTKGIEESEREKRVEDLGGVGHASGK